MNPCDDKDVLEILQSLVQFSGDGDANEILDEFDEKISVYLKYEWEKAKREVNYFSWLKISYWLTFVTLLCYTVLCDAVAKFRSHTIRLDRARAKIAVEMQKTCSGNASFVKKIRFSLIEPV